VPRTGFYIRTFIFTLNVNLTSKRHIHVHELCGCVPKLTASAENL